MGLGGKEKSHSSLSHKEQVKYLEPKLFTLCCKPTVGSEKGGQKKSFALVIFLLVMKHNCLSHGKKPVPRDCT